MVPRPAVRSSRLMPMPLSETVRVLASLSSATVIANGAPSAISSGSGDRLVAQLLAGVGGVGDEFADEDFPVGIDRMDHQVQQARNVGLEALGRRGLVGRGRGVGGQIGPLSNALRAALETGGRPDIVALPPGFKPVVGLLRRLEDARSRPTCGVVRDMTDQPSLFDPEPSVLPEGFRYQPDCLDASEERTLAAAIAALPLTPFAFHGFEGKRRVASFGWGYDFAQARLRRAEPIRISSYPRGRRRHASPGSRRRRSNSCW